MSRYLTVRALMLLLVAAALIAVMVTLGRWQFDAYRDQQDGDVRAALTRDPVPLDQALGADSGFPSESVGRPVAAAGTYAAEEQIYARDLDGANQTFAVVTPLVTASGSAILVVRGSSDQPAAEAPSGTVHVRGVLEPSAASAAPLDGDRVTDGIRIPSLVPDVTADLYAGYLVLTASEPADPLSRVEPPTVDPSRWAGIRNLLYAAQWWLFACFVAFMWWRMVNDAGASSREPVG